MSLSNTECKVRSPEIEAALDARIAVIRRRNKAIEERIKIVTADKATALGVPIEKLVVKDILNNDDEGHNNIENVNDNKNNTNGGENQKNSKSNDKHWNREWDAGKTKAEDWITNVPPIDDSTCYVMRQKEIEHGRKGKKGTHRNSHGSLATTSEGKKEGEEKSSGSSKENNSRVTNKKHTVNRVKNNIKDNGKGLESKSVPVTFNGPLASRISRISNNENNTKKIGMKNNYFTKTNKDFGTRKHQKRD
uniref:rRNA-processing protein EBP2 n=1 Tax=Strongyloides venezuelensis TaxID=75913 RepID=A0A0K0FVQ9_STRVS